jgi:ParB family chromosome partitioning protein
MATMSATTSIPDAESVQYLSLDLIDPAPSNRDIGPEEALEELARSIKAKGVLQAIVVSPKDGGRFEIVFGHRRFEGARRAGLETIKSEVRDYNEQERRELRLIENVLRKDPTPIEEALAYQELLQINPKLNQAKLAARLGIAQGTISRRLKLLGLPKKLQEAVNSNRIPAEDAYHLAKLAKFPERIERARAEAKKLGSVQLAVNKELEDLKNALKRETASDDLKTRGITLAPDGWQRKGMRLGDEDGMLPIDPFEHQTEPCHAAIISDAGAITYVCTEPKRHGWGVDADADGTEAAESTGEPSTGQSDPETSSASTEPTGEDKPQTGNADTQTEAAARAAAERKAEAEAERARVEALRDAEQVRRTTLRTALKGKLTKDMERHIYWQVLNAAQVDHDTIAKELLDLPAADGDESPLRSFASKSDERLKKAAFAVLAMLAEGPLQGKNPNFEHETAPQHYQMLSRLGYTPTQVERDALGSDDQAPADVA